MRWTVTVAPTGMLLDWNALKARCRIDDDFAKADMLELLAEVTADAEERMECSLLPRTITAVFDRDDRAIELPRGPIIEITSATDGNNAALAYHHETVGNVDRLHFTTPRDAIVWPVTVIYQAGYTEVPADIVGTIKIETLTRSQIREAISDKPANKVYDLDAFYRRRGRGSMVA